MKYFNHSVTNNIKFRQQHRTNDKTVKVEIIKIAKTIIKESDTILGIARSIAEVCTDELLKKVWCNNYVLLIK